jgi:hypothetical protein
VIFLETKQDETKLLLPRSRSLQISLIAILAALTAVLTAIIIPMPSPIGGFDPSTVLILSLGVLYGPVIATPIIIMGQFVGTLYLTMIYGYPLVFLPGIVAVRGSEAFLVGVLRKKNEMLAVSIGPIWETIAFLIADIYLFGPAGLIVITTLVDLLWVPVAIIVIGTLRSTFGSQYLDEAFGLQDPETSKKLLYPSILIIILAWVLIFLAPGFGWL